MTWPTMSDTFQAGHSVGACQSSPRRVSSSVMRSSYAPVATSAASVVWVMGVIWSIAVVMVVLFDEQFRRMRDELTNGARVVADNPGYDCGSSVPIQRVRTPGLQCSLPSGSTTTPLQFPSCDWRSTADRRGPLRGPARA